MQLFKKKSAESADKSLDLPELPSFPEVQEIKDALKPNVSVGTTVPPLQNVLNQAQPLKAEPKKTQEIGASAWSGPGFAVSSPQPAEEEVAEEEHEEPRPAVRSREPIFIKIDKFSDALNNFEQVKKKVGEIDELLKQTRDIRQREQEEFDTWEKELIEIKGKLNAIDEKLFSRLE